MPEAFKMGDDLQKREKVEINHANFGILK